MSDIQLQVKQAYANDTGQGVARLAPTVLEELQLTPGGFVTIEGSTTTVAKVQQTDFEDWNDETIRIDGFTRQNADVTLGDHVTVQKATLGAIRHIILAPTEEVHVPIGPNVAGLIEHQLRNRPVSEDDLVPVDSSDQPFVQTPGETLSLIALEIKPNQTGKITEKTSITIRETPVTDQSTTDDHNIITYEEIGGLENEVERVREMIELPIAHPTVFRKLGIEAPKGVLLHGPPGTGKTLLAKAVANETDASFHSIAGPEIISKYYGESEEELREIFASASDNPPAIIFLDELDSIAPTRNDVTGEVERRVVAQLLPLMDGLENRGDVVVIGATNRPDAIDPALRRPGRFDREIEIGVPSAHDREEILQIHTRGMPLADDVDLDQLAADTHGFVGADIASLAKEAAMHALRRYLPDIDLDDEEDAEIPPALLDRMSVTTTDFDSVLSEIKPSALRDVRVELPDVTWDDVGGLRDAKQALRESIVWSLQSPEKFDRLGIDSVTGVLLYGPPGTGKTLLAKVVANEADANFIPVRGPEILSKWTGESEAAIRDTFRKARESAPAVVFFDELDSLAAGRSQGLGGESSDRLVNQLLTELDGIQPLEDVMVVGATNRPDMLDEAILRTSRFDRLVNVGAPDVEGRTQIFKVQTDDTPLASDVSFRDLAEMTEGYVGSDIEAVAQEAAIKALREQAEPSEVALHHFSKAIADVRPTMTETVETRYERITDDFENGQLDDGSVSGPRGFR
ncbi:CDC48 family AAA ATPase [Halorussus limi]|uniref:CDC48 family AAA ATPase n=2 Tax=Halorussus TaxID=1070314 RepID=A0A8U0IFZ9_9EURY|nr:MULTISPECIES: CDC48 family AAA ATPase [Halorussus]UPV73895.1 CDC48 family AAA ATPase [Halorussus limi]UPV99912.1 CDC48 family AAA ATPase [Halorussus gelatinilyticus]